MKNSDKPQEPDSSTSEIVRIAYRQSRIISNSNDSIDTPKTPNTDGFACTNRIMGLPIFASLNSSIAGAYTSVKSSHSTVESILNHTEEGLTEGANILSPVTSKIGETLQKPLKSIDSVICDGLDYLEEKVPSVKLPPGEIYENVEGYIRDVSESVKKHSNDVYTDVKVKLDELTKTGVESPEKTETPDKHRKFDV